jgi:hypothetical protein
MGRAQRNHRSWLRQALILSLCFQPIAAATPRVVDRAAALINGEVLTLSELEFETRVLFIYAGGVEAATAPLELDDLKSALDSVIGQRLATAEADKLEAYPLEEGSIESAMRLFRSRFRSDKDFDAFTERTETDATMIAAVLSRFLRTQRVFDGKFRLRAQPTEADLKRARAERPELKELALAQLKQKLVTERYAQLVAEELKVLRKAAQVRLLGPFAQALPDGGR